MTKNLELEKEDINTLLDWGYLKSDIPQIQKAIKKSSYELYELKPPYKTIDSVSAKEAAKLLGNKEFLSGISRSSFHWSACREVNKKLGIMFDSSALFK